MPGEQARHAPVVAFASSGSAVVGVVGDVGVSVGMLDGTGVDSGDGEAVGLLEGASLGAGVGVPLEAPPSLLAIFNPHLVNVFLLLFILQSHTLKS